MKEWLKQLLCLHDWHKKGQWRGNESRVVHVTWKECKKCGDMKL